MDRAPVVTAMCKVCGERHPLSYQGDGRHGDGRFLQVFQCPKCRTRFKYYPDTNTLADEDGVEFPP